MGCSSEAEEAASASAAIVGGQPVDASTYPATGALVDVLSNGQYQLHCTATLIAPRAVLTAAHCFLGLAAGLPGFTLAPGLGGGETVIQGLREYSDPEFDPQGSGPLHDIGILELQESVAGVQVASLLDTHDGGEAPSAGIVVELVGYGAAETDGGLAGEKREAAAPVISVSSSEMTVGAVGQPQDCLGDSGGPAFVQTSPQAFRLAGVVSRSAVASEECTAGAILTRVDAYSDWIQETLASIQNGPSTSCATTAGGAVPKGWALGWIMALVAGLGRLRRIGAARSRLGVP